MKEEEYEARCLRLIDRNSKGTEEAKSLIMSQESFSHAAVLALESLSPQAYGACLENWIKKALGLGNKRNNHSGDTDKGDEIKVSIENGSKRTSNFVQIRPHHEIRYYLFVVFSVTNREEYWFKIPSEELYKLLPEFGNKKRPRSPNML
jgi:hypothetical protein